jgi:hypothetical protein
LSWAVKSNIDRSDSFAKRQLTASSIQMLVIDRPESYEERTDPEQGKPNNAVLIRARQPNEGSPAADV